ncbi:MAG: hypothetical protein V1688_01465 [bacterium]
MEREKPNPPNNIVDLKKKREQKIKEAVPPETIIKIFNLILEDIKKINPEHDQQIKILRNALMNSRFDEEETNTTIIWIIELTSSLCVRSDLFSETHPELAIKLRDNLREIINSMWSAADGKQTITETTICDLSEYKKNETKKGLEKKFKILFAGEELSSQTEKNISDKLKDAYIANKQNKIKLLLEILKEIFCYNEEQITNVRNFFKK